MDFAVNAALWVVGKALAPVTDGLVESWAASTGLGPNVDALKMQLLYAKGMLDTAQGKDIHSAALKELLNKLRELAYGAEDALDELDYFRIQDVLDGTYHAAADAPTQGSFVGGLVLNARHTAHATGKRFSCHSSPSVDHDDGAHTPMLLEDSNTVGSGRRFLCGAWSSKARQRNQPMQTPKLKFDRVEMSRKMMDTVEQLKPLCAMVSTILKLDLLGSNRTPILDTAVNRQKTTPKIVEPEFYGRDDQKKDILDGIKHGKYCTDELTVIPLVGPGGIGKTTLTKHIYSELESSFQVSIWICVSLDFNADKLAQNIAKMIPKVVNDDKENASDIELIEQRLKSKRLLLVLDDIWTCHEDEWNKLLAPLRYKGGEKGNVIIVTTRIPEVASMTRTTNSSINDVERLAPNDIMSFFEVCVFGNQQPWKDHPEELHDVGKKIVTNLKGFPLAAKTVGRLLRKKLTLDHWTTVADSREWELQTGPNDIMPALKLSYDHLPFHLQQCFSYCALVPEDYEFGGKELVHLWIGLGILHSCDQRRRIEDVGLGYLDDLVNYGFFKKIEKENGHHYVIHDLLHDLALKVSSYECLSIYSSNVRSIQIPASVRHLSIIVDDTDVKDIMTFKEYKSYLSELGKRLKVQNLRTLMLFGGYHGSFAKTFRGLFREARALRTIFLSGASYSVDDVLLNFSKLVHLRYLRIKSSVYNKDMCLPSALFRSYHLEVIDLENWRGSFLSTSQMNNLVQLRHFLVPEDSLELHSSIFEVGKLKFLEELRRFEVGKGTKGFEPSQLGELTELGGSLGIYNLEKVRKKEEANELKLLHKNHLHKLTLGWDMDGSNKDAEQEENIIDSLVPHSNLHELRIQGHRGVSCPSWLGGYLSVKNLESLSLYDVSWNTLPPLGELGFIGDPGEKCKGLVSSQSFQSLKRLELVKIPRLTKWVGNGKCHLFSLLEVVTVEDCPKLVELPFSHPTCREAKQEENMTWFPKLRVLTIMDCPKLASLPPIPWTQAPCSAVIERAGSGLENLVYSEDYKSESTLEIKGEVGLHSVFFWKGLAFHNLADLRELEMVKCPPLPLIHLQKLKSLKTLSITSMSTVLLLFEGESHLSTGCPPPVERVEILECDANGEELTRLLSHFPKLGVLRIWVCQKITGLGVVEHQTTVASPSSSASNKFEHAQAGHNQQMTRGEDEVASAAAEGLLLLPPQLQDLYIRDCKELRLLSDSLGNDPARVGLQSLRSLRIFGIEDGPKFLSSFLSSASSSSPFPNSLQSLQLKRVKGMETLDCLSNLVSLDRLNVLRCPDLRGDGLWPLVAQCRLTPLHISGTPKFFTGLDLSLPHDEERRSYSSKLKDLQTDDLAGVLTLPICNLLSSSLTKLTFAFNEEKERFTEEQEDALHLLDSLQGLVFRRCNKLQRLPAGLTKLTNLKRLQIWDCPAIQLLPKDRLPSSLQELQILDCPSIKSLPKDVLPSSLLKLQVRGINEELKRQCQKLKGTVPIIIDYY